MAVQSGTYLKSMAAVRVLVVILLLAAPATAELKPGDTLDQSQ
jgi:hypothetical protein